MHNKQKEELKQKYETTKQNLKDFEKYKYMLDKPEYIVVNCPHCDITIIIYEINCGIFRCGIYKNDYKQIGQHLSRLECDKINLSDIYGCTRPFRLQGLKAVKCDYI